MAGLTAAPASGRAGPAVRVAGLSIADTSGRRVVDNLDLQVPAGRVVGIVGESGSGKTTLALALLGHVRQGLHPQAGTVEVGGHRVLDADAGPTADLQSIRGSVVSYVPQNPGRSLNPSMRVKDLLASMTPRADRATRTAQATKLLTSVRLPTDAQFLQRWPHQLSGGQQQRLVIAMALARTPSMVVLDEPTTGLDVITQAHILDELRRLQAELELTLVYISHDLAVVGQLADDLVVMRRSRIVESGPASQLFGHPEQQYTQRLLDAVPDPRAPAATPAAGPEAAVVLHVKDLVASHPGRGRAVIAADGIDLTLHRGECLALVGESGSGKTTTLRSIAGLHRDATGTIALDGVPLPIPVRRRGRTDKRRIQLVLQNPLEALNPRQDVTVTLTRALTAARRGGATTTQHSVAELLTMVELDPQIAQRYPRQLSGGEQQRVAIARALAADPDVLLCDEITSALDVTVQAAVLDLLDRLRRQTGVALLFVTHDLGVVAQIATQVAVLDRGHIVETGPTVEVLAHPRNSYTQALLAAAPSLAKPGHISTDVSP